LPIRISSFVWPVWVAVLVAVTEHVFRWHLDYFNSPGPNFHRIALIFVPGVAVAAWVYARLRTPIFYRYEPAALAILVVAACMRYEPRASIVVAALFLACSAIGRFAFLKLGLNLDNPIDRIATGFGAGTGMLILTLLAAGLVRLHYPAAFIIILLLPLLLLRKEAVATLLDIREIPVRWRAASEIRHPIAGVAIVFGFVAAACTLMIMLAPSIAFDPVVYHLPSVQYYAGEHALRPVPGIDYSFYPQGVELLWTFAYVLAGQAGAQMISALFFAVFLAMLFRLGRVCRLDTAAAVTATVFAATLPFLHWSGSVMKNDLALAYFEALALYAFVRWLNSGNFRWIPVGAFFLAQGFGVKYVALFGAVPLAVLYGYSLWQQPRRWRAATFVAAVFLVFGTVWPVRAYLLTGNPVAPDHLGLAAGGSLEIHETTLAAKLAKYSEIPWMLIFDGLNSFESPLPNPAGILLFAFAPLVLLTGGFRPRTGAQAACALFAAMYLVYWASILTKVRYAIFPFALLCVLSASLLKTFYDAQRGNSGWLVKISLIGVQTYCLLIAMMGFMIVGINGPQFAYFAGRLDKQGYLRAAMQAYGAVEFLSRTDRTHARVLGVDNVARAYSPDPSDFDAMWCPSQRACDADKIVARAKQDGAEYLILPEHKVPNEVLERLGSPEKVYRDEYFSVYRLNSWPVRSTPAH
jgi:hypothetical protein